MAGKPLITAEIGTGTSYVNRDRETGLVVPPADPEALRKAMDQLHGDPGLAEAMGTAARKRYEMLFTADKMGEDYFRIYQRFGP